MARRTSIDSSTVCAATAARQHDRVAQCTTHATLAATERPPPADTSMTTPPPPEGCWAACPNVLNNAGVPARLRQNRPERWRTRKYRRTAVVRRRYYHAEWLSAAAQAEVVVAVRPATTPPQAPPPWRPFRLQVVDDGRGGVGHNRLGVGEHIDDVLHRVVGLRLHGRPLRQRSLFEVGADHHDPLVAGAVLGAAPRRLGCQVESAEAGDLTVVVGAAFVVAAVLPHRHRGRPLPVALLRPVVVAPGAGVVVVAAVVVAPVVPAVVAVVVPGEGGGRGSQHEETAQQPGDDETSHDPSSLDPGWCSSMRFPDGSER